MSNFHNMRKAHNKIKFDLIRKAVEKCNSSFVKVFDVSVGRFGDMHSYMKAGVDRIVGIDPDETSISEAISRMEKCYPEQDIELYIEIITNDSIFITEFFNIVVCNFTLHYFFENLKMLENAISNISKRLKSGGYFIGTSIDGEKLIDFQNDFIKIQLENEFYTFELFDDDSNYFSNENSKRKEYKTNKQIFKTVCEKYDLEFVSFCDFSKFPNIDRTKFKDHEKIIHDMYFTFVFYKI